MMNAAAGGRRPIGNATTDALKNKRLKEIREWYKECKKTPQQQHQEQKQVGDEMIERMRQNGVDPATIALYAQDFDYVDSVIEKVLDDENPRDKIASQTFAYKSSRGMTEVTISSMGSRNWRLATVKDTGSIVYMPMDNEFGKLIKIGEEPNEEFPDEINDTAIIRNFSGRTKTHSVWAFNGKFDDLLVVPKEVLEDVKNEAPPGRFFSGKSVTSSLKWSPAPAGKTWMQHPFLKNPNGLHLPDEHAFYTEMLIDCPRMKLEIREKSWREREAFKYWCPVLKKFISEGERLRQEHWFHNGDGSAQQRYFYKQNEMLDKHGGLDSLPLTIGSEEEDISFVGVMGFDEVIAKRKKAAELKGEIIEIDMDSKMPAKKQRTT